MKTFILIYSIIVTPICLGMFFFLDHNPADLLNAATAIILGIAYRA